MTTYAKRGKDVATLRAEQEQAQIREVLEAVEQAARLLRSRGAREFAAEVAYFEAGLSDGVTIDRTEGPHVEEPEWAPAWLRPLLDDLVAEVRMGGGVDRLKQMVEGARGEDIHA